MSCAKEGLVSALCCVRKGLVSLLCLSAVCVPVVDMMQANRLVNPFQALRDLDLRRMGRVTRKAKGEDLRSP